MNKKYFLMIGLGIITILIAILLVVQVVESDPLKKDLELAKDALDKEKYKESIEQFSRILEKDALNTDARISLANAYIALSQFDKAIEVLKEGIKLKPNEPQFYYILSNVYESLNDFQNTIKTIETGLKNTNNTALSDRYNHLASNIKIEIDRHFIQKGHSRNLTLLWHKDDGKVIPVEAKWSTDNESNGELTTITEKEVTYNAKRAGNTILYAAVGSIIKETEITIEDQVIEEMTISPEELDPFSIGQEVTLVVSGTDADGKVMEFIPEWTSSENIVQLKKTKGQQVSFETVNEGITTITIAYQEFKKEIDIIVDGDNKYIKTNVLGEGNIIISPDEKSYPIGTDIVLKAEADEGWEFVRWEGNITSTSNPLELTVEKSMSVIAVFEKINHELILSIPKNKDEEDDIVSNPKPSNEPDSSNDPIDKPNTGTDPEETVPGSDSNDEPNPSTDPDNETVPGNDSNDEPNPSTDPNNETDPGSDSINEPNPSTDPDNETVPGSDSNDEPNPSTDPDNETDPGSDSNDEPNPSTDPVDEKVPGSGPINETDIEGEAFG